MEQNQTRKKSIERNRKRLLMLLHSKEAHLAKEITRFAGSMPFAYIHLAWFTFWILANHGVFLPIIPIFDPFPYGLLTMIVSLEAIFLSTFIMVAQNIQELRDKYRDLEEDIEQKEEEEKQGELEENVEDLQEDVQDIQKDLDSIIKTVSFIQQKITTVEKPKITPPSTTSSIHSIKPKK